MTSPYRCLCLFRPGTIQPVITPSETDKSPAVQTLKVDSNSGDQPTPALPSNSTAELPNEDPSSRSKVESPTNLPPKHMRKPTLLLRNISGGKSDDGTVRG